MIPRLDGYALITPTGVSEALALLADDPSGRPFAGGTDLMVLLEAGHLPRGRYVSLWGLRDLRGIAARDDVVAIGASTTYTEIRQSDVLASRYPMLVHAASETGGVATQNRGTIGGNIANASPAADTPPALLAYDAWLELQSASGSRRVDYRTFHTGYKTMDLRSGEIIARVLLPARATGWRDFYRKVGTRRAQAISKVCIAGSILMDHSTVADIRIAMGSVAPCVVRCPAAESALRGRAIDNQSIADATSALARDIAPLDDLRSTAQYRLRVAQNLLSEFLSVPPGGRTPSPA
jgi:CO/xanthine dehydrogenase FAD-binding subunit